MLTFLNLTPEGNINFPVRIGTNQISRFMEITNRQRLCNISCFIISTSSQNNKIHCVLDTRQIHLFQMAGKKL